MIVNPVRYWTIDELKELKAALDASDGGRLAVLYRGHLGRFVGLPVFTVLSEDLITVDGLDFELMEPPV